MNCPRIPISKSVVLCVVLSLVVGWAFHHAVVAAESPSQFYLVGVGLGDPDLITLRAVDTLKRADLVFSMKRLTEKFSGYLQDKQVVHGYWRSTILPKHPWRLSNSPATLTGKR